MQIQIYLSLGFRKFEPFPTLRDEWDPSQITVMSVGLNNSSRKTDAAEVCKAHAPTVSVFP